MPAAETLQHADLNADEIRMKDAEQLIAGTRRIGERSEDIENRAHAELAAHRRRVLHGRMMIRREHEADAGLGDAFGNLRGR